MNVPDYCEALTAYRCWNAFDNGLLVGQAHPEPWPPYAPFVGRCGSTISSKHVHDGQWMPSPIFECDCGVHAFKLLADAEQRMVDMRVTFQVMWGQIGEVPNGRVWGAVKVWGRIIEHEIGYRAEFAYPSMLFCEDAKLAPIVAALYGVPCEVNKLAEENKALEYWLGGSYSVSGWSTYTPPAYLAPQPPAPTIAPMVALGASRYQRKALARAAQQKLEAEAKKRELIQKYLTKATV